MNSERFYLAARGVYALAWSTMVTVSLVFMVEVAGLDPLQMVLVGTVLELSVFLFEIPTGVVADRSSRRTSVIIGHFLIGVGFLVMVVKPVFAMILLAQVIWGVGWTFGSITPRVSYSHGRYWNPGGWESLWIFGLDVNLTSWLVFTVEWIDHRARATGGPERQFEDGLQVVLNWNL